MRAGRVSALAALVAVAGATLVAPPVQAVEAGTLAVSPAEPMGGERLTFTGDLPPNRSRPVNLQQLRADGSWRTLESRTSRADGTFTFTFSAPGAVGRTPSYRVAAPRVRLGGTVYRAVETPVRQVTTVAQSGTLTIPATAAPGADISATATITPVRVGRVVVLQRLVGTEWVRVASSTQTADGTAAFTVAAHDTGSADYRARAWAYRGARSTTTPAQQVTVLVDDSTPPPAPSAPTAAPGDGSVELSWPAVAAGDLAGYHVHTSSAAAGPWSRLTGSPHQATEYDVTGLGDGATAWYAVSAIDDSGNESDLSEPVAGTTLLAVSAGVTAGDAHSCAVAADGAASCWGDNARGKIGDGTDVRRPLRTAVAGGGQWVSVDAGSAASCGVRRDGTLWCWGAAVLSTADERTPTQVGTDTDWRSVAAGAGHRCALKADGTAWCWGFNSYGQLGDGTTTSRPAPVQVGSESDWVALTVGERHTCGIREGGSLWCWGLNGNGQLGLGPDFTQVEGVTSEPTRVGADEWRDVTAAFVQTCAVRQDGTAWCWGYGSSGALGNGTTDHRVASPRQAGTASDWTEISTGESGTCALKTDGAVWCWGSNVVPEHALSPTEVDTELRFAAVDVGRLHACGTTTADEVVCWGYNASGQLGDGRSDTELVPLLVSDSGGWSGAAAGSGYHACAIKADDSASCWGLGTSGQLGSSGEVYARTRPTPVESDQGWASLAAGEMHTCGLTTSGTIWCWGRNDERQLGDGTTEDRRLPTQVGDDADWATLTADDNSTCATKTDGTAWCWGYNASAPQNAWPLTDPQLVDSSTDWAMVDPGGQMGACGVRSDGTAWCWGHNNDGQVGDGTTERRYAPVQVGTATDWASISSGHRHACGTRTDGSAWCWGYDAWGQLGNGAGLASRTPVQVSGDHEWAQVIAGNGRTCGIDTDGRGYCWGLNQNGVNGDGTTAASGVPTPISGGGTWTSLGLAQSHTCGTKVDGSLWCWGWNGNGYLGVPIVRYDPQPVLD